MTPTRFVQQVASFTRNQEIIDDEPFDMESDDAVETVNSLISKARECLRDLASSQANTTQRCLRGNLVGDIPAPQDVIEIVADLKKRLEAYRRIHDLLSFGIEEHQIHFDDKEVYRLVVDELAELGASDTAHGGLCECPQCNEEEKI